MPDDDKTPKITSYSIKTSRGTIRKNKNGSMRFTGKVADDFFRALTGQPPKEEEKKP